MDLRSVDYHPTRLRAWVHEDLEARNWLAAAARSTGKGLERGVDLTVAQRTLKIWEQNGQSGLAGLGRHVLTGGQISEVKYGQWYPEHDVTCRRCGQAEETLFHRYWQCPANALMLDDPVYHTQHLCEQAAEGIQQGDQDCLWLRALVPRDLNWPPVEQSWTRDWWSDEPADPARVHLAGDGSGGPQSREPRLHRKARVGAANA